MNRLCYPMMIGKNQRAPAIFSMTVLAAMQFLILWLITTLDYTPILNSFLEQLPPAWRMIFEEEYINGFTTKGAAAFGFNHPIVLSLLALNAIIIPARHIAGEIEAGTLELLLAYPVKRSRLLFSLWMSAAVLLLVIVSAAWVSSLTAVKIYHELSYELFINISKIAANLCLLFVLIMSLTLLISTFSKESAKAGLLSAAIVLVLYFLNFISKIWESIGFIKPFNIFSYYQPQQLMMGERSFTLHFSVLSTLIFICLAISIKQLNRRDIP